MGSSSRGKSESQISREDNSRIREYVPAGNRVSIAGGQNILPDPINLLNNNNGQYNYLQHNSISPMLITVNQTQTDRPRTSSTITYTPYNKQLLPQVSTPTQSMNQSRTQVTYSSNSTNQVGNTYTTINSSNMNVIRTSFERK